MAEYTHYAKLDPEWVEFEKTFTPVKQPEDLSVAKKQFNETRAALFQRHLGPIGTFFIFQSLSTLTDHADDLQEVSLRKMPQFQHEIVSISKSGCTFRTWRKYPLHRFRYSSTCMVVATSRETLNRRTCTVVYSVSKRLASCSTLTTAIHPNGRFRLHTLMSLTPSTGLPRHRRPSSMGLI